MSKNNLNQIELKKGKILNFNKKELNIRCLKGAIWLTFVGSKDILLEDGNEISLKKTKSIILEALKNSHIELF